MEFGISHGVYSFHFQAGKGRTGLMVCAYLVYSGLSAEEALHLYAHRRTTNNKGVSHKMRIKCNMVETLYFVVRSHVDLIDLN